jgi:hypothetical protein
MIELKKERKLKEMKSSFCQQDLDKINKFPFIQNENNASK